MANRYCVAAFLPVASPQSIEQIVEEACNFGQQGDITIFRVTRLAQSAPVTAARLDLATEIAVD